MLFIVRRASREDDSQPHPKAFRMDSGWFVKIENLDELLEFAEEDSLIVSAEAGYPAIMIHDDYLY